MTEHTPASVQADPRVLVVEDDADIRELLELLLIANAYDPVLASTGREALDLVEREPFDLVVLDLRLPDISGYEVCRRMRTRDALDVPILMLTANQDRQGPARGLQLGADDYVRKPFDPDELLSRLEALRRRDSRSRSLVTENGALTHMLESVQRDLGAATPRSDVDLLLGREFLANVAIHLGALCRTIEAEYRRQSQPQAREAVQRILGQARGLALVYDTSQILQEDPADVDSLVHTIATALKNIYAPQRIPLTVAGEPVHLPLVSAAPLARIVNELITNSFKHAFPNQRFGSITVRYNRTSADFTLQVIDDGVGMPEDGKATGRGRDTVQSLAQALGGSASWESTGQGTTATIRFPIAEAQEPRPETLAAS